VQNSPRILTVVPAYNEGGRIGEVVAEIREAVPEVDIVVVDDASGDHTAREAARAGARVVRLPANLGIGGAVQAGFKFAEEHGYDIVVQVDGDGQHDPGLLRSLVDPILRGEADMVIGSRYVPGSEDPDYETPLTRRLGISLFSWITTLVVGHRITDVTSGFRAINRKVLAFFASDYPADFPDAEAAILVHYLGARIHEVPVRMRPRRGGKSSTTPIKSLYYPFKVLISILAVLLRERPKPV